MDVSDYARQQSRAGYSLHFHDGIWWQRHHPFYYKPAFEYQLVASGAQRPSRARALVGYSHAVAAGALENGAWPIMVLEWAGKPFALECLNSKKRNQVRKGLGQVDVRRIGEIDSCLADLQEINISTRQRTGVGKPADYYTRRSREWAAFMRRLFALEGREWWGAFRGDKLVAYYYAYQVDDTLIIDTAKSNTEFLSHNPNDALLFSLMSHTINDCGCRRIVYGGWTKDDNNLTHFKEQHGFVRSDIPSYAQINVPARWMLRVRDAFRRFGSSRAPSTS